MATFDIVDLSDPPHTSTRDYVGEMRDLIDKATADRDDGYIATVIAQEIVDNLREHDPGLLQGWLDLQAVSFVRSAIAQRDHSIRSRRQRIAKAQGFGTATDAAYGGDTTALESYLHLPFTLDGNIRKPLGKLSHDELLFVRDDYQNRANENLFYRDVMGALAERVTDGVVEDHFTEQQLRNLFGMFGKR